MVNSRIAWSTAVLTAKVLTDNCCVVFAVLDNAAMRAGTAEFVGLVILLVDELSGTDEDE